MKLHKGLLKSFDFFAIPVNRRWEWPLLLLMSDDHDGIIQASDEKIGFHLYREMGKPFDPTPFIDRLIVHYDLNIRSDKSIDSVSLGDQNAPTDTKTHQPTPSKTNRNRQTFDAFWALYPVKKAKEMAFKAWVKLAPDDDLQDIILKAVALHSTSDEWKRDGGKFIPHAATYLNQKRWEDQLTIQKPKAQVWS